MARSVVRGPWHCVTRVRSRQLAAARAAAALGSNAVTVDRDAESDADVEDALHTDEDEGGDEEDGEELDAALHDVDGAV